MAHTSSIVSFHTTMTVTYAIMCLLCTLFMIGICQYQLSDLRRYVNRMFRCVNQNVFRMFHDCYIALEQHFGVKLQDLYMQNPPPTFSVHTSTKTYEVSTICEYFRRSAEVVISRMCAVFPRSLANHRRQYEKSR